MQTLAVRKENDLPFHQLESSLRFFPFKRPEIYNNQIISFLYENKYFKSTYLYILMVRKIGRFFFLA